MPEKFLALPREKQNRIIESAMTVFGAVGYKKTYISEIAAAAGISKAMIFFYFGSKKALYLYLIEYAGKIMITEVQEREGTTNTDFFDRIVEATWLKLSVMNHYPAISGFLSSIYYENDPEVVQEIKTLLSKGEVIRLQIALDGADESKFKNGVDPKLVLDILVKFTEGALGSRLDRVRPIDEIMTEFTQCLNLLKNNLYKDEFLK